MPLNLPRLASLNPSVAYSVGKQLMSVVAGRPGTRTTYQFYEELDAWLGPWGPDGYPIGYGKKYNLAFTTDPILNSPSFPVTRRWVWQTSINLQLALVDEIVKAIISNRLYRIVAEDQIRDAAFSSHPMAYLNAGLREVAACEPACLPLIAMIPYEQFNPLNPDFFRTFNQVVDVIREPGIATWFATLLRGNRVLPFETLKLALEEAKAHMPNPMTPSLNPKQTVEELAWKAFLNLVDRYQPLRRIFAY
jgi:hypothetical protein